MKQKYLTIPASVLKWIALVSMLVDHAAVSVLYRAIYAPAAKAGLSYAPSLYRIYRVMRGFGRLAFPIYCFLLVEGFVYTKNIRKYMLRLAVFALISEIPFNLGLHSSFWYSEKQNVYFTLLIGLAVVYLLYRFDRQLILQMFSVAVGCLIAHVMHTDYGWSGILLISSLYYFRKRDPLQYLGGAIAICRTKFQLPAMLAFPLMALYNGERGRQWKYFFYAAYPAHLLLFYAVSRLLLSIGR